MVDDGPVKVVDDPDNKPQPPPRIIKVREHRGTIIDSLTCLSDLSLAFFFDLAV